MSCYGEGNRGFSNSASKYSTRLVLVCASIYFPQQRILTSRTGRDHESIHLTFFPTPNLMLSCFVHFSCVSGIRMHQSAKSLPQENRMQLPVNLSLAPSPADKGSLYFVCNWAGLANMQLKWLHRLGVLTKNWLCSLLTCWIQLPGWRVRFALKVLQHAREEYLQGLEIGAGGGSWTGEVLCMPVTWPKHPFVKSSPELGAALSLISKKLWWWEILDGYPH